MSHFILGKGLWFSVPTALLLLLIFSGNVNPSSNSMNNVFLFFLLIGFIASLPWSLGISILFVIVAFGYNDTWWSSPLLIFLLFLEVFFAHLNGHFLFKFLHFIKRRTPKTVQCEEWCKK